MKGFTIQNSIDLLEKAVEKGGGSGGSTTAASVTYDNTTSHLTADDVQEAIDEIVASMPAAPTAATVTYDNTTSGLTADDVQEAIDEIDGSVDTLLAMNNIGTTETKIGTYKGADLYAKLITTTLTTTAIANTGYCGGDTAAVSLSTVVDECFVDLRFGSLPAKTAFFGLYNSNDDVITIYSLYAITAAEVEICILYTKPASSNTRKKK